jgi:hypothetical protein
MPKILPTKLTSGVYRYTLIKVPKNFKHVWNSEGYIVYIGKTTANNYVVLTPGINKGNIATFHKSIKNYVEPYLTRKNNIQEHLPIPLKELNANKYKPDQGPEGYILQLEYVK